MPSSESISTGDHAPTAWVLSAPGAGDNRQLETLVDLIGARARWMERIDSVPRVLADRLRAGSALDIPTDRARDFAPPWPDLVLIAGGRSVIDARRIRHASGGRSKIVCLGRPWAPLAWFDLVITTPQYRLPAAANVLSLDLPLNRPPPITDGELDAWRSEWCGLARPHLAVLLGGRSGSFRFGEADARRLAGRIDEMVAETGGTALVVGSPRTPAKALAAIELGLTVPARVYPYRPGGRNPYAAALRLADALLVTSDSASMLAEACCSGLPASVFELTEGVRTRLLRRSRRWLGELQPVFQRWTERGLWIPARDLALLHERARAERLVVPFGSGRDEEGQGVAERVRASFARAAKAVRNLLQDRGPSSRSESGSAD